MANIKSAKKRVKISEKNRKQNQARNSDVKSSIKKCIEAIENKNVDQAKKLLQETESKMARAAGKGLLKKRTVSRKVSRLAKKLNTLGKK